MKRSSSLLLAGLLAVTMLLSGCSTAQSVATVDGTDISKAEYDKAYQDFARSVGIADTSKMPIADPKQKAVVEDYLKTMTINKLIVQTLVKNAADEQGVAVTDADVTRFKDDMFKREGMKEQFQSYLQKNNLTEADFDRAIRESLLLDKFVEKNGAAEVAVSKEEIQKLYQTHQAELKLPERYKARHILVEAIVPKIKKEIRVKEPTISDADLQKKLEAELQPRKAKAEDLYKQVKANPGKFAELAKSTSDDKASGAKGGELGYIAQGPEIEPNFWNALNRAPVGKLAPGVIQTPLGFHVLQVEEHLPPKTQTLAESQDLLRRFIGDQKKQIWLQEWLKKEKAEAKIVIKDDYKSKQPGGEPMAGPGVPQTSGANAGQPGMPQAAPIPPSQ